MSDSVQYRIDQCVEEEQAVLNRLIRSHTAVSARILMEILGESNDWRRQYIIDSVEYYSKLKRDKEQQMSESTEIGTIQGHIHAALSELNKKLKVFGVGRIIISVANREVPSRETYRVETVPEWVVPINGPVAAGGLMAGQWTDEERKAAQERLSDKATLKPAELSKPIEIQKPSIGRIVLYRYPSPWGNRIVYPAIIKSVGEKHISLCAFTDDGPMKFGMVTQGDGPGQWSWPERS